MMQHVDPTTLLANANMFESVPEGESPESDKEIQYLRKKVKGAMQMKKNNMKIINCTSSFNNYLKIFIV